ncbi:putative phosphatidate phosphatase [Watersipora subatra]|uniref:putative phosphatidate phosphatase n=1 Tax=Watersipora subatra TaxID=2589382 RepID=UPI00355B6763
MAVKNALRIFIDVIMLILVAVPSVVFKFANIQPTQRGFYCDDESIRYPYHSSTISTTALILVSGFMNIVIISICEIFHYHGVRRKKEATTPEPLIWKIRVNRCFYSICGYIWILGFGLMANQGLTDIGKWTVGRLRPHFIQACDPANKTWINNCNVGQYIEEVICTQPDQKIFNDLRLSFPSGHASLSAYAMVFLAYYIQKRIPRFAYTYLLKNVLQFVCIAMAWFCALSRVMDYKHHPTDVLGGFILGTIVALFTARFLAEGFRNPYTHGSYKRSGDIDRRRNVEAEPSHVDTNSL